MEAIRGKIRHITNLNSDYQENEIITMQNDDELEENILVISYGTKVFMFKERGISSEYLLLDQHVYKSVFSIMKIMKSKNGAAY